MLTPCRWLFLILFFFSLIVFFSCMREKFCCVLSAVVVVVNYAMRNFVLNEGSVIAEVGLVLLDGVV